MSDEDKKKDAKKSVEDDSGQGPGCLKSTITAMVVLGIVIVALLAVFCLEKVNAWEVGLRYWKYPIPGVVDRDEPSILKPGWNIIIPKVHEFAKYDCSLQTFNMHPEYPDAPDPDHPPLAVRTASNQDEIEVYVTIYYQVDRTKATDLRKHYPSNKAIKTDGIEAICPQILQYHLGKIMTANQFYSMSREQRTEIYEKRKTKPDYMKEMYPGDDYLLDRTTQAYTAMEEMNRFFLPKGVRIVDVQIWDFKFKDEIEASIISKVIADEKVEMETAVKEAAAAKAEWQKLVAEADAAAESEMARGTAESRKLEAEGEKYMMEKLALGDREILEAQAEGKGMINKALAGRGGRVYVGLEYAKALEGIELIVIPAGGEDGFNPLQLDETLEQLQPGQGGAGQ